LEPICTLANLFDTSLRLGEALLWCVNRVCEPLRDMKTAQKKSILNLSRKDFNDVSFRFNDQQSNEEKKNDIRTFNETILQDKKKRIVKKADTMERYLVEY
jgi:uncharacterized membrane protein YgaE (UPF0421/DUF939 family)